MSLEAAERDADSVCNVDDCNAWRKGESVYCRHHIGLEKGPEETTGAPENNDNAVTHGMHQSAETFFANAPERHLDTYYAMHESLCRKYELQHGREPFEHDKKELAEVAFEMAKLDMAKEYEAKNAVDETTPLTEKEPQVTSEGVFKKEVISKVESLKTDIRRENRLALKDKGIYSSPEQQQADATKTVVELLKED